MKFKELLKCNVTKVGSMITTTVAIIPTFCSNALATPAPDPIDLTSVQTAITNSISVSQITGIIAACIGGGMGFALIWFGARKLFKTINKAFKTGKISF